MNMKKGRQNVGDLFSIYFAISVEIRQIFRYKNAEFAIIPL